MMLMILVGSQYRGVFRQACGADLHLFFILTVTTLRQALSVQQMSAFGGTFVSHAFMLILSFHVMKVLCKMDP